MNLRAVLEGLLFIVGDEGLEINQIQDLLQTTEDETKQVLKDLVVEYYDEEFAEHLKAELYHREGNVAKYRFHKDEISAVQLIQELSEKKQMPCIFLEEKMMILFRKE